MFQVEPANRATSIIPKYHLNRESRWCHNRTVVKLPQAHVFLRGAKCQNRGSKCPLSRTVNLLAITDLGVSGHTKG